MSVKAVEVSTKDFLELEEAIERDAPISEIRELLKRGRFYYASEKSLQLPAAVLFERILQKYVVWGGSLPPQQKQEEEEK